MLAGLWSKPPGHYRRPPHVSTNLRRRQADADPKIVALSWKTQRRLHHAWEAMQARGKRRTIIAVACARELAGFLLGGGHRRVRRRHQVVEEAAGAMRAFAQSIGETPMGSRLAR
jgi:hypothetical protein